MQHSPPLSSSRLQGFTEKDKLEIHLKKHIESQGQAAGAPGQQAATVAAAMAGSMPFPGGPAAAAAGFGSSPNLASFLAAASNGGSALPILPQQQALLSLEREAATLQLAEQAFKQQQAALLGEAAQQAVTANKSPRASPPPPSAAVQPQNSVPNAASPTPSNESLANSLTSGLPAASGLMKQSLLPGLPNAAATAAAAAAMQQLMQQLLLPLICNQIGLFWSRQRGWHCNCPPPPIQERKFLFENCVLIDTPRFC